MSVLANVKQRACRRARSLPAFWQLPLQDLGRWRGLPTSQSAWDWVVVAQSRRVTRAKRSVSSKSDAAEEIFGVWEESGVDSVGEIRSGLVGRLLADTMTALDALNADGASDVYGVAIIANSGFFSGVGLVSNTVAHLAELRAQVNDPSLGSEYFELSAAEWNRFEWDSFANTNEYLNELEELYYEDELPFEDEDALDRFMIGAVVDVLRQLDLRQRVQSHHAASLYVGLGYSNPSEKEGSLVLAVGEVLNDQGWVGKLRTLYGKQ